MGNPAEETTITRTLRLRRKGAPSSRFSPSPAGYVLRCGWPETLVPVGEDLFGFPHLVIRTAKVKSHFSGSSGDQNLNGRQPIPLHSEKELLVGFVNSVVLETIHG
jgi:hypothetical protein